VGQTARGRSWLAVLLALGIAVTTAACGGSSPSGSDPEASAGGAGQLGDGPGGASGGDGAGSGDGTAHLTPLGVSVLVDRKTLVLPDGTAYPVDMVPGGALDGYQTPDGWLIRGFGNGIDTLSLWLVSPTGSARVMVERAEGPVAVAPDGRHLGWRSDGKLYYGHVDPAGKAVVDKSSPAPERGFPVVVGTDSLVLGYSETGGGLDHHDVWFPGLGDYKPTWDKSADVRAVYSPGRGDGTYLGLVRGPAGDKDVCVAVMNPKDSLKATRTACGIVTQLDRHGAVSPDGHWLAMFGASSAGKGEIDVVDLTAAFGKPAVTVAWPAEMVGAWEDANNMLVASTALGGALVRYHLGTTSADPVTRPGVATGARVTPLPRVA
jgi:hypothetical protein